MKEAPCGAEGGYSSETEELCIPGVYWMCVTQREGDGERWRPSFIHLWVSGIELQDGTISPGQQDVPRHNAHVHLFTSTLVRMFRIKKAAVNH